MSATDDTDSAAIEALENALAEELADVQIHTDDTGRHWDGNGTEYEAYDVDGELGFRPISRENRS